MIISEDLLVGLKPFLSQRLTPICDADPDVLSEYVLALLKHDLTTEQLMEKCRVQLNDFLREHTVKFVSELFEFISASPAKLTAASSADVLSYSPEEEDRDQADEEDEDGYRRQRRARPAKPLADEPRKQRVICKHFERFGSCPHGSRCRFRHAAGESPAESKFVISKYPLTDDVNARRLIVDKIPTENCHKQSVFYFFKRFGRILDIEVDPRNRRATVLFNAHDEAVKAFQSPEPMFGNRFVKIFWDSNQSVSEELVQKEEVRVVQQAALQEQMRAKQQMLQKEQQMQSQIEKHRAVMERLQSKDLSEQERAELLSSLEQPAGAPQKRAFGDPAASALKKSRSIDFRPKTLRLSKVPDEKSPAEMSDLLQKWQPMQPATNADGSVDYSFPNRYQAELAFSFLASTYKEADFRISWV